MILDPGFEQTAKEILLVLLHFVEVESRFSVCHPHTIDDWGENDRKAFKFEVEQLLKVAASSGFGKEEVLTEMEEMEGPLHLSPAPSSVARDFFGVRLTLTREPFAFFVNPV